MADSRTYAGSAWRSRFLRAPKVALTLAARDDFAPVGDLATVSLGLKTGADKFFFPARLRSEADTGLDLGRRGCLVSGFEGWQGALHPNDLLPALVGPHELFDGKKRRFRVPKQTERLYLYPAARAPRGDLRSYVQLGEIAGVNQKTLVSQNAGGDWWRQVRPLVRDAWALPYNSAYDYGAWDNSSGAVLNGRFVGASPRPGVSSDLLGAALNSTFAIAGRLLEGMATGTEGAFDVGPPAVRLVRIPDVRCIEGNAASQVLAVLEDIRRSDAMPPAPASDGSVSSIRRRLDAALLQGLGLTAGEAAALQDELYASYARWRADVEDVERQMQQNRRQMSRSGQVRSARPIDVAGKRVWEEISHRARLYPCAFLFPGEAMSLVRVPKGAPLPAEAPLFEPGLITNGTERVDLEHHSRVRYVSMLKKIGFDGEIAVLLDPTKAGSIVDRFNDDELDLRSEAVRRASAYVSRELADATADIAMAHWLKACRQNGMTAEPEEQEPPTSPAMTAPLSTRVLH